MVLDELGDLSDISEGFIAKGEYFIGFHFSEISYIYSGAIGALLSLYKKVKPHDGDICIIEPKDDVNKILHDLHLERYLRIVSSLDELPEE